MGSHMLSCNSIIIKKIKTFSVLKSNFTVKFYIINIQYSNNLNVLRFSPSVDGAISVLLQKSIVRLSKKWILSIFYIFMKNIKIST